MTFTRQQLIFLGAVVVIIIVFLVIFFAGGRRSVEKINLAVWGVDDELAWDYTIYRYQKTHPGTRITYTEFDPATYEKELINALAAGRGPDIFMLSNRWVAKHADKVIPMPEGQMTVSGFSNLFPQIAEEDFLTDDGGIYGLPLSIDTLALFYNRDIFDRKGIALLPKTWEEFLAVVPKLRSLDKSGNLTLAAAAIGGTAQDISNAPDILELLMLQTGALTSDRYPSETVQSEEGGSALEFYTQFSNPKSQNYSWNESFSPALESFAQGKIAMAFGYANDTPEIKAKNPFLNFAVASAPQADPNQAVTIANYWALVVSSKSLSPGAAWDFVIFAATDSNTALDYMTSTGRPPALRSLISDYVDDVNLGVFVRQALVARSFYEGDDVAVRDLFDKAIQKTLAGKSVFEILDELAAELINLERQ